MIKQVVKLLGYWALGLAIFAEPISGLEFHRSGCNSPDCSNTTIKKGDLMELPYVGMWITADGYIRQELRADGRYDEARGNQKSAYQGRYKVDGTHIDYWDDTGFTADGTFISVDELHHGGMIFYREKK